MVKKRIGGATELLKYLFKNNEVQYNKKEFEGGKSIDTNNFKLTKASKNKKYIK